MCRTSVHVFVAIVWAVLVPTASMHYLESAPSTPDITVWAERLLGAIAVITLGFFAVLWSWLRHDAVAHGRPKSTALKYALASIPSCGLAMFAYFYSTREGREATVAMIAFIVICAVLVAVARA